jgi:hypothetical protein
VSKEGVPIDTPLLAFPAEDLSTINGATGLAYPVKAERARRNPKVGLLIEGGPDEPVVSIGGMAAVRDADIQANTIRYLSEVGSYGAWFAQPWEVTRPAVWYWARIIMEVTPARILWWDTPASMDQPAHRWAAPPDTVFPASDAAPFGRPSAASQWPEPNWRDFAQTFLDQKIPGYLTLLDPEGFPLPIGARRVRLAGDSFELDMPKAAPWAGAGMATLTFAGCATFVGSVTGSGSSTRLAYRRMLPVHPMVLDPDQVLQPSQDVKAALMARLSEELARRGQDMPQLPAVRPEPTPGALRRQKREAAMRTG